MMMVENHTDKQPPIEVENTVGTISTGCALAFTSLKYMVEWILRHKED